MATRSEALIEGDSSMRSVLGSRGLRQSGDVLGSGRAVRRQQVIGLLALALALRSWDSNDYSVAGTYRSGSSTHSSGLTLTQTNSHRQHRRGIIFGGDAAYLVYINAERRIGARQWRAPLRPTHITNCASHGLRADIRGYVNGVLDLAGTHLISSTHNAGICG